MREKAEKVLTSGCFGVRLESRTSFLQRREKMKYKIMTYNICSGHTYFDVVFPEKPPLDLEKSAEVIKSIAPDICGLNEVDLLTERSGNVNQTEYFKNYLGMEGVFGRSIDFQGGFYGNALLSRFPISSHEVIDVPDVEGVVQEHRTILKLRLDIAGGVTLLQIHAGTTDAQKEKFVNKICEVIDSIETPLILMGDFNMTPDYPILSKIRDRLADTAPLFNGGEFTTYGTYPKCPKKHIDYIFVSKEIKPLSLTTLETMASDHYPLIMECEI